MTRHVLLWTILFLGTALGQTPFDPPGSQVSRLNRPRGDSLAGNGVDTGTGAFQIAHQLLTVQGGRTLDFPVIYNSRLTQSAGALGPGWTHPYEARIGGDPAGTVVVRWDAVRENSFSFAGTGNSYRPLDEAVLYDKLDRLTNGTWRLVRQDGTVYEFEANGRLRRIGNKIFQYLDMQYDTSGRFTGVREPLANRLLRLTYQKTGSNRLESVRDAVDRTVYFEYDSSGRLAALRSPVTLGDGVATQIFNPQNIPDNNPTGLIYPIEVGRSDRIGLVKLFQTTIVHSRPSDLSVFLISPQGTRAEVPKPVPSGDSNTALVFNDMILSAFDGENPRGTWRVAVVDGRAGFTGQLEGWHFVFSEPADAVRYASDSGGRIVRATDPNGNRMFENQYDSSGRVVAQDDGIDTNAIATFTYATAADGGIQTTYRDRLGNPFVFDHDSGFHLRSVADPLRNTSTFAYNANGDRIRATDPLGRTHTFAYDQNGDLLAVVDPASNVTSLVHDARHNLTSFRDALGKVSRFEYNSNNNLTAVVDAKQHRDTKTYGGSSQMTGMLLQDGAGVNYTFTDGMPTGASHPDGHGLSRSTYDAIGRPVRLVDPEGSATTYEYNSRGDVTRETNALNQSQFTYYDRLGRPASVVDRAGNPEFFEYDGNGNRIQVTDAMGGVTRFQYDGEDRLVRILDANGNDATFSYDAAGRRIAEADALGNTATYEFDAAGQLLSTRDAAGTVLSKLRYDGEGNVAGETDAFGNTWNFAYDALGRRTAIRDPLNRPVTWRFDELDRPVEVRDAAGRTFKQEYLEDDVLSGITDGRNKTLRFGYGPANRLTAIRPPAGSGTALNYDGRDRLRSEVLPGGVRYEYTHDQLGRIAEIGRTAAGQTFSAVQYAYDANGNTIRVSQRTGTGAATVRLRRTFDRLNRVTSYTGARGETMGYAYDAAGNLKTLTYPDGKQVTYTYDQADRLVQVRDWAGRLTRYTYDKRDLITKIVFPNGTFRAMDYDAGGRVVRRRDMTPQGGVIVEYRYTFDALGNIASLQPQAFSGGAPAQAAMTYDDNNRLLSFNGAAAAFDANGNLTRGPLGASLADFRYDLAQRLTVAGNTTYTYDEEDRLVGYSNSAGTTLFAISPAVGPSKILTMTAPNGSVTRYVYGVGLVYEETGNDIRVFHYDHRGNTSSVSGAGGAVSGTIHYGPFGEIVSQSGATDLIFKFAGMFGVMTDPNGLSYMRFRWYSQVMKRFLNQDAHFGDISLPATLNRYSYGANNPIMLVDPDGQFFNFIAAAIGAAVGVAVALVARGIERAATGRAFVEKGEEWGFVGELVGAAVGGGIAGACLGACGGAALAVYGAVGGLAGNLVKQGIRIGGTAAFGGDSANLSFDVGDLAAETVLGGVFGGAPGLRSVGKGAKGLKGGLSKKISSKLTKTVRVPPKVKWDYDNGGIITVRKAYDKTVANGYGKLVELLADTVVGAGQGLLTGCVGSGFNCFQRSEENTTPTSNEVSTSARQSLYQGKKARFGEHAHWRFYQQFLTLAGRPAPNVPQNMLATF